VILKKERCTGGRRGVAVAVIAVTLTAAPYISVHADEADARTLLQAMSDYVASQDSVSFDYDATREVVTVEDQKLGLASSGTVTLGRPDRVRATRTGGFVDVEMLFDGTTLTLVGHNANVFAQTDMPGSIDQLIDELRDTYGLPLPAADLIVSNPYEALMSEVVDVKDLGSGVIGGVECDHLAFRTDEVDWEIWIAHGERPYPCRYVITSRDVPQAPQYTIEIRDWRTGDEVAADDFAFERSDGASEIEFEELSEMLRGLPEHFSIGDEQ